MALAHPIFVPLYTSGTPVGILKVVQSGFSTIFGNENGNSNISLPSIMTKNVFVWDGNIILPVGHFSTSAQGGVRFNPKTGTFNFGDLYTWAAQRIPLGDRIGFINTSWFQSGPSPRYRDHAGGSGPATTPNEWAVLGDTVHVIGSSLAIQWAYPFTTTPGSVSLTVKKLCPYKGFMYALEFHGGGARLAKYNSGWSWVAAIQPITDQGDLQANGAGAAFFEAGGKLWFFASYNNGGTQWHRIFEVDETAGTFTEDNTLIPSGWKGVPTNTTRRCFDVIDDTGASRLVYLFAHNDAGAGWDCYEFDGVNPMNDGSGGDAPVSSGGHRLGATAGAIWDESAAGCHVEQSFDSVPSEYATIKHRTYDIGANAPADVDLRYEDLSDPTSRPVFPVCSEKTGVGSEGKTNLITKPAGITTLADLNDDFSDDVIDPILWEIVNPSIRESSYDFGGGSTAGTRIFYSIVEGSGEIRFGASAPTPAVQANNGIGLKSRWGMTGAFTVRARIANLAALLTQASRWYKMVLMVKEATNQGYGIFFWRNTNVYAKAFSMSPNNVISVGADGATLITDGMDMDISRDALGNFTMTVDANGTPEVLASPGTLPLYTGEMQAWIAAFTETSSQWTGSPQGPGFSDFQVFGAGGIGLFEGGVQHDFMWDHVLDLGVGQNLSAVIHADTD